MKTVPQPFVTESVITVEPPATPPTTPVDAPTVAAAVLLLVHVVVPNEPALDKVMVLPIHTDEAPVIAAAIGSGFTVTTRVEVTVAQVNTVTYLMVAVSETRLPVTTPPTVPAEAPVATTVATEGLRLDQVPPVCALVSTVVAP